MTKPVNAQASCQDTVDAVAKEMRKKGTSVALQIRGEEMNPLENQRRKNSIFMIINSSSKRERENIINSTVLLKNHANRILKSCSGTGYVSFFMGGEYSPYEIFGMTDGGTLGYQKCSDNYSSIINRMTNIYSGPNGDCAFVIPDF
ncbi:MULTISPECIES: hypothetical protein [unclassified Synechocystis]|uniref:hypothetical protein n=1 Tax=unclassified Synechocystis TaxID=2640012 RepID=UPI0011873A05|nr:MULTISPECIES: hypothetical protein [unclassified Synechocystis]MCT0254443.1 hypothetical protein [Synechocystis sp. CS-94]